MSINFNIIVTNYFIWYSVSLALTEIIANVVANDSGKDIFKKYINTFFFI